MNGFTSISGKDFSSSERRAERTNRSHATNRKFMTSQNKIDRIKDRLKEAQTLLESCCLCPRRCGVNRRKGETGFCGMGADLVVSSDNLHYGEEPPISGARGSGTIFLSGCNLGCIFCQNYPISHLQHGNVMSTSELARRMIHLQERGAHNINFVTPTHFAPLLMEALGLAYEDGLDIPIIYNCGGYEALNMLSLWDGIVDIYMPDMKYSDSAAAKQYSSAPDYPQANREAIREMHRQVGNLQMDKDGIAQKGLLIRHLVLPENIAGTMDVLHFIAHEISDKTTISLMSQYFPAHKAVEIPPMHRRITKDEYAQAKACLNQFGLHHGWVQD